LIKLIKNQGDKLSSIPAIQPVSNKELNRIASGFGDAHFIPFTRIAKMHNGLDFTAPQGNAYLCYRRWYRNYSRNGTGTGNHVIINHGYGYETVYMHMVRVKAREGTARKRGEVIGWVGSTGASTGPHCHYEVHIMARPVDPVYFFFNDLMQNNMTGYLKLRRNGSAQKFD